MNTVKQINPAISMRIYQKLLNKGFKRVIYKTQSEPNVWYKIEFTDEKLIEKFVEKLGESIGYWDYRLDNTVLTFEIREDLSFTQYLITEVELKDGGNAFFELTIEEFESILDLIDDKLAMIV